MTPEQVTALIVAIGALFTAVGGLCGAVAVLWRAVETNRHAIDGRVDELVSTSRVAGHAEGIALAEQIRRGENQQPTSCVDESTDNNM